MNVETTTRRNEIAIAAGGAIVTTIAVAALKLAGAVVPAAFIAGVGAGAVVEYVILTNRELLRRNQR